MKRHEASTGYEPTRSPLFGDIMRRVERVRAATRALLGRTATSTVVERPPAPAPVERARQPIDSIEPTDVGKLSFRGYMAYMDRKQAAADPTPANKMRLRRSEELLAEERRHTTAPISSSTHTNKATYNWATETQAGPAVLGGRFGYSSRHPEDPTHHRAPAPRGAAPMLITNPDRGGYIYTQGELDAANTPPNSGAVVDHEFRGLLEALAEEERDRGTPPSGGPSEER